MLNEKPRSATEADGHTLVGKSADDAVKPAVKMAFVASLLKDED